MKWVNGRTIFTYWLYAGVYYIIYDWQLLKEVLN